MPQVPALGGAMSWDDDPWIDDLCDDDEPLLPSSTSCVCCSAMRASGSDLCADCYVCDGCGLYASHTDGCEVCNEEVEIDVD